MSQPKRDIADFFRPFAKTVPRKRSNPDGSEDRSSSASPRKTPSTPRADREKNIKNIGRAGAIRSPTHSLTTPRSGRSAAIPFRSPSSVTPSAVRTVRKLSSVEDYNTFDTSPSKPSAVQSFSEIPSSNRTVFEDGKKVAVRDSDDSDDSLQSLNELVGRRKESRPIAGSSQPEAGTYEEEGRQLLNLFSSGRSEAQRNKAKLRELQKREQANKVDLSYIYEHERKEVAARERIARLTAVEDEYPEQKISNTSTFDKANLATVLKASDDEEAAPEELNRLLHAVDRTEALSSHKSYSFFNNEGLDLVNQFSTAFPATAIPGDIFKHGDQSACKRMFLSGFMSELASKGHLNDDAIRWTFDMVSREQREDVLEAYLGCMSAASARWTRANVGPADVQLAFECLGMNKNVLNDEIAATFAVQSEPQPRQYQLLTSTLKLLRIICEDLDFASLSRLCSITCRLLVDERTMSHNRVSKATHQLIHCLLDLPDQNSRQHVHDRLRADLGANLKDPVLQALLLQNLVSTTPSSLQLKSELAILFLHNRQGADASEDRSASSTSRLSIILAYLSSSRDFSIRSASDLGSANFYTILHALTVVINAAIGDGDPPISFLDRNEEHLFNADVDDIARHIEKLYTSIPDSGASHMTRTEAKNALLDLQHRLLSAVRTRPKKKRHIFDGNGEQIGGKKKLRFSDVHEVKEESKKRDFMARFLHKKPGLSES